MINAYLIIKPLIDKGTFHRAVESVTGLNYLRETDEKNLADSTAELVSILRSYGEPYDSSAVVPVGFVFVGTVDLVGQLPSIVKGSCLTNQQANSAVLSSMVIVATLSEWDRAVGKPKGNSHLDRCFAKIRSEIEPMILIPNYKRLT